MKKNKSVKNSTNIKAPKKYILVIGLSLIFLFVVLLSTKLNPGRLLGSVYNATDIESNIDKLKIGDTINYEINGYSDWQVVYIDRKNNTVDVVSKTNTEDITLLNQEDYDNFLDILQTTANKYVDGNFAIKARSVSRADLDNFPFEDEFWNADVYNGEVAYNRGRIKYESITEPDLNTYSFIPYIKINNVDDYYNYYTGATYTDITVNGVSEWFVLEVLGSNQLTLIPKEFIDLSYNIEELRESPKVYFANLFEEMKNSDPNIVEVGSFYEKYGSWYLMYIDEIYNYFSNLYEEKQFFTGYFSIIERDTYREVGGNISTLKFPEKEDNCCDWAAYKNNVPVTKGFRPIVTLKFSNKTYDGKNFNDELQVGDNVNYTALGYSNWKVLSIDKENNTVDIISGGIVKNITFYGEQDFEDYEQLLLKEIDQYKVGDNVIGSRIVEYGDIANLNAMKDDVNVKYWALEKKQYNRQNVNETSSPYLSDGYYEASVLNYNSESNSVERKWVTLFISSGLSSGTVSTLSAYNGVGDLSFTAGLRPILTLKLDQVEKTSNTESNQNSNNQTNNTSRNTTNNRSNNNINVSTNITNNETNNEINNGTSNDEINKEEVNNYYNNYGYKKGSRSKLFKYIIIAIIVLNIAVLVQIVVSVFIIKNMDNKKRKK